MAGPETPTDSGDPTPTPPADPDRASRPGTPAVLDPHAPGCLDLEAKPLSTLPPMKVAVIERVDEEHDHADRLKALGLCVGRKLQVVKTGDPLIVRVLGSRLGLSARLAERVFVAPCMNSGQPPEAGPALTAAQTDESKTEINPA